MKRVKVGNAGVYTMYVERDNDEHCALVFQKGDEELMRLVFCPAAIEDYPLFLDIIENEDPSMDDTDTLFDYVYMEFQNDGSLMFEILHEDGTSTITNITFFKVQNQPKFRQAFSRAFRKVFEIADEEVDV